MAYNNLCCGFGWSGKIRHKIHESANPLMHLDEGAVQVDAAARGMALVQGIPRGVGLVLPPSWRW